MSDRWETVTTRVGRKLVAYGPFGDRLPARFTWTFEHGVYALRVTVAMSFDGTDRVKVDAVTAERTDGASVTPEDTTRLQLAHLVHSAGINTAVLAGARVEYGRDHDGPPDDDELRRFARTYWTEYVTWGKPRRTVTTAYGLSRTTATRWIHAARDAYGLPGPHAEED